MIRLSYAPKRLMVAGALTGSLLVWGSATALEEQDFNFDSTANLAAVCGYEGNTPEAVPAQFACRAFLKATMQYHDAVTNRKQLKPLTCPPPGTTVSRTRTVFLAWAKANAAERKRMAEPPVVGVVRALAAEYPCK